MEKHLFAITMALVFTTAVWGTQPNATRVFAYMPAPGQFINELPHITADSAANAAIADSVLLHTNSSIYGSPMVCLGSFGGYIVMGFDHDVPNIAGSTDFKILGNAFGNNAEPGVIMVAADNNGNGLPDDTWSEIAGSAHDSLNTRKNYTVTYYKPTLYDDTTTAIVSQYIRWCDSRGDSGYLSKNAFHHQSYYPAWCGDSVQFTGTRLPNNGIKQGSFVKLKSFEWGYADNHPNNDARSEINIDWAVDSMGVATHLSSIRFIKIYTGVLQDNGMMTGECSTEVCGAIDLHHTNDCAIASNTYLYVSTLFRTQIEVVSDRATHATLLTVSGQALREYNIAVGSNYLDACTLPAGLYLLRVDGRITKVVKAK